MINLFRADIYRLVKTKSFWLMQLLIVIAYLSQFTDRHLRATMPPVTTLVLKGPLISNELLFCILPLLIYVLETDFTKDVLKNSLTFGLTRTKYFFSKILIFGFFLLLQISWNYFFMIIACAIVGGAGSLTTLVFTKLIYLILVQWLLLFAIALFSLLILVATKNVMPSLVFGIMLPWGMFMLHGKFKGSLFNYLDIMGGITNANFTSFGHTALLNPALITASILIVLCSVLSDYLLVHTDL